jgi:ABC-type sugar transport system permease subunit
MEAVSIGVTTVRSPEAVAAHLRKARRRSRLRRNATAWAFLAPSFSAFAVFLLFPVLWVARQSFMEGGVIGPAHWVGFENWSQALQTGEALTSLRNTFQYMLLAVPAMLLLAFVVALALHQLRGRGSAVRAAIYLPSLAPFVLAALVWFFVVHPDFGLLNVGSRVLGTQPVNWLGDESLALPTLAMLEIWRGIGFWALFLLAALLGVRPDLYAAAALDGASVLRRFWHVTLPAVRPALATAGVLAALFALQVFDSAFVLTKGGPAGSTETAVLYIYQSIFQRSQPGDGAVVSLLLLGIVLLATAVVFLLQGRIARRRAAGARA